MNINTRRPKTIREEVIDFLTNNTEVVNPLIISKGIRRKMSLVRKEMDKMISEGILLVEFDEKNFFTSIKIANSNEKIDSTKHSIRSSSTGRFVKKSEINIAPLTEEEVLQENTIRTLIDQENAYGGEPEDEEAENSWKKLADYVPHPQDEEPEIIDNSLHDAISQHEAQGEGFYKSKSELLLNESSASEQLSFWSRIKKIFN